MTFDLAHYEATLHRIDAGLERLSRLVDQLPAAVASAAGRWYLPGFASASLTQSGTVLASVGHDLVANLRELVLGAIAPIRFYLLARDWTDVRGLTTSVAGDLQPAALSVGYYWQGRAADAYGMVVPPQIAAAVRIGTMADKTQTALTWSAAAGAAFYLGVLVVLGQLIIVFVGVLAGLMSVELSWAALDVAVQQTSFSAAEIVSLVSLLGAALTTQYIQLRNLESEAGDVSAFPRRHWPESFTDRYLDATVADGDAEWSLEQR
jgi:hypothetical protein